MKSMRINTKAGIIEVEISGNRREPKAIITKFSVAAFIGKEAHPGEKKGCGKGIWLDWNKGFVQNPEACDEMKKLFSELPDQVWKKEETKVSADGQTIAMKKWPEDFGFNKDKNGNVIHQKMMEKFLDQNNISEIERETAINMWNEKVADRYAVAKEKNEKFVEFMYQWDQE